MNRSIIALLILSLLIISCKKDVTKVNTSDINKTVSLSSKDKIIEGEVIDIHMIGIKKENVTLCHFDPNYVVVIKTKNNTEKLAIHSPTKTFVGEDAIGKTYKLYLQERKSDFLLTKVEKINR